MVRRKVVELAILFSFATMDEGVITEMILIFFFWLGFCVNIIAVT